MLSTGGYGLPEDDDADAALLEHETGVEDAMKREVVVELAMTDADAATQLARQAVELGYTVELQRPDDADGFFGVICSQMMAPRPAEIVRARRELEALAVEIGNLADEIDES